MAKSISAKAIAEQLNTLVKERGYNSGNYETCKVRRERDGSWSFVIWEHCKSEAKLRLATVKQEYVINVKSQW